MSSQTPDGGRAVSIPDSLRGLRGFGLPEWVFVAAGGALGALLRGLLDATAGAFPGPGARPLMWSTIAVNVLGALLLGAISAWFGRLEAVSPALARIRLFLATGFCGAFTTYSTFALATTRGAAGGVAGASMARSLIESAALLVVGVGAAWVGWRIGMSRRVPVIDVGPREDADIDIDEGASATPPSSDLSEQMREEDFQAMLKRFEDDAARDKRHRHGHTHSEGHAHGSAPGDGDPGADGARKRDRGEGGDDQ